MKTFFVTPEQAGERLDKILASAFPDMGLRGRRRLCEQKLVAVNGKIAAPAFKVRLNDEITVQEIAAPEKNTPQKAEEENAPEKHTPEEKTDFLTATTQSTSANRDRASEIAKQDNTMGCFLVAQTPVFAAVFKPAGLHSEHLAGGSRPSVQDMLTQLLQGGARLLNRLDAATSGLVMASCDPTASAIWKSAQNNGQITKRYLALVEGAVTHDYLVTGKLILNNPRRVLVELASHPDRRRHTHITPLCAVPPIPTLGLAGEQYTLVGCTILKGARHQIRAHLSSLRHPVAGDVKYGAKPLAIMFGQTDAVTPNASQQGTLLKDTFEQITAPSPSTIQKDTFAPSPCTATAQRTAEMPCPEKFFLHHGAIDLPQFSACCLPDWLEALLADAQQKAVEWLHAAPYRFA